MADIMMLFGGGGGEEDDGESVVEGSIESTTDDAPSGASATNPAPLDTAASSSSSGATGSAPLSPGVPQSPPHNPQQFVFPVASAPPPPPPQPLLLDPAEMVKLANSRDIPAREYCVTEMVRMVEAADPLDFVIEAIIILAQDSEPVLRGRVAEKIPEMIKALIARGCSDVAENTFIPLTAQFLVDQSVQVRACAKNVFISVIREGLFRARVVEVLAPTLEKLTADSASEDHKTESLMLMAECAEYTEYADRALTKHIFVPIAMNLAKDQIFRVRKTCCATVAALIVALAQFPNTVDALLSVFDDLCVDEIWGVRKACAEALPMLATSVNASIRAGKITRFVINLANDQSRWVRSAAYKSLGAVIASFAPAPPPNDELLFSREALRLLGLDRRHPEQPSSVASSIAPSPTPLDNPPVTVSVASLNLSPGDEGEDEDDSATRRRAEPTFALGDPEPDLEMDLAGAGLRDFSFEAPGLDDLSGEGEEGGEGSEGEEVCVESSESKSEDAEPADEQHQQQEDGTKESMGEGSEVVQMEEGADTAEGTAPAPVSEGAPGDASQAPAQGMDTVAEDVAGVVATQPVADTQAAVAGGSGEADDEDAVCWRGLTGEIVAREAVPDSLVRLVNGMMSSESVRTIDSDVCRMCAYNIPAVAWALGPGAWHAIRDTYFALASNDDWKVRSTLAYSIHVLAQILGRDVAERDLAPLFDSFLKDWDDVRIGVVRHFAAFLRVLSPASRRAYLPLLVDLKEADEVVNWRFRRLLSLQLAQLGALFQASDVATFLCPLALVLGMDKIACVRSRADLAIAALGGRLVEDASAANLELMEAFAEQVIQKYARNRKSIYRLNFVHIAYHSTLSLKPEHFERFFLDPLLELMHDRVPNVRLMLARVVSQRLQVYLEGDGLRKVLDCIRTLQQDSDRDTRYFSSLAPGVLQPVFTNELDGDEQPPEPPVA